VLWNADFPSGNGTAWRRYTSSDLVNWADQGVSIPKYTTTYGDVWTGSSVVDTNNSAGYGAGAVIAIMTMPCNTLGGQGSGLWYSTNEGQSFQFGSIVQTNPLAGNTTISDLVLRDPCIFWHTPTSRWVMSIAEVGKLSVYSSADLKNWVYESAMPRTDLGTLECPHSRREYCVPGSQQVRLPAEVRHSVECTTPGTVRFRRAPLSVSVFIDAGSVEIFVNDGLALSGLITTPTDATGLSLTTSGGNAGISKLVVRY
jgi:sucrose-6-phosphate hydrolase SacC (GH32 family)